MEAKDKAYQLVERFYIEVQNIDSICRLNMFEAKQCALIAVYEIMEITQTPVIIIDSNGIEKQHGWQNDSFWFNVKQEIEKL
jgi:hypothetical protein